MRNKMGCLVFGLLALLVITFFNGGGDSITELPTDVIETSGAENTGNDGDGGFEPLGDLDTEDDGMLIELEPVDGAEAGGTGSDGSLGVLSGEIDAQVSDVQYAVLEATNEGSTIDTLEADGEFIVVRLLMANSGTEPLTYFGANMVDDHGQEYSYVSNALEYIVDEEACEVVTIEPGEEQICTMVYDVNDDANAVGLILTDLNLLGGEEVVIELTGLP